MINKEALDACYEIISNSRKTIITTHINPDGDAIGSALALYFTLKHLAKDVEIIIDSDIPHFLLFLSGSELIKKYNPKLHDKSILQADTIFFLDLNDIKRTRAMEQVFQISFARKVLIDHHINSQDFCNLCVIDSSASSTGELIWRLLVNSSIPISKEIADAIYVAIMTDTGSFRFSSTTSELHRIIADVIDCGANPCLLYENVYNQNQFNLIKLLGLSIASMELFYSGKLSVMTITDEMLRATNTTDDDVEGFVEKTLSIKGVEVGILITEVKLKNEMRVSFRSKGNYDVRSLAARFGGGGHLNASGARIKGSVFLDTKKMLIATAQSLFNS